MQSMIYHNMGVILQGQKDYADAIDCYKNSLRRNPANADSRYNLALCQYLLKKQPPKNRTISRIIKTRDSNSRSSSLNPNQIISSSRRIKIRCQSRMLKVC